MAGVSFSKRYLFRLIGKKENERRLLEHVPKMGVEVKGITKDTLELDITPNRPDLLDIVGFARSVRSFTHRAGARSYGIKDREPQVEIKVEKSAGKMRPFISALVAKRIKLDDVSLAHFLSFTDKLSDTYGRRRSKLAIGVHNLDKIVSPLTYGSFEGGSFVPLGQGDKMSYSEAMERTKQGSEYGYTIGNGKRRLFPALKDAEGTLALIPIINSERTKVTPSTANMLIDITGTSGYAVERMSELLACSLMDSGAEVSRVRISYPDRSIATPEMKMRHIEIPLARIEQSIGVIIGFNNVLSLAAKMGYGASYGNKRIKFSVPQYRMDIISEQDVVEDMAIAYGYDYIQPIPVFSGRPGRLEDRTTLNKRISVEMVGLGFSEVMNSYLTSEAVNFGRMLIKAEEDSYIRLKDSKTQNITMARTWLLPSLLGNLSQSVHESMPQRIFEVDYAFGMKEGLPSEGYRLCCVIADPKANFNDIKAVAEDIIRRIGIDCRIEAIRHGSFVEGRVAGIISKRNEVGLFGELHPEVLDNFKIEEPCFALELGI